MDFYDAGWYDISRHIESGARGIIARADLVPAITKLDDVLDLTTLALKTNFVDVGSAREGVGSAYNRNITTAESRIEASTVSIRERITAVDRTITLHLAEFTPDKVAILEEAPAVTTIAAAANSSPQSRVDGGVFNKMTRYRVVLLGIHPDGEGRDITDTTADVRGPLCAWVLQNARMSAENAGIEIQRGQIADAPLTFKGFPEPTITDPAKSVVSYIEETGPATISAT